MMKRFRLLVVVVLLFSPLLVRGEEEEFEDVLFGRELR